MEVNHLIKLSLSLKGEAIVSNAEVNQESFLKDKANDFAETKKQIIETLQYEGFDTVEITDFSVEELEENT